MKRLVLILSVLMILLSGGKALALASGSYLDMAAGIDAGYLSLYPGDTQISDFYKGGTTLRGFLEFKAESGLNFAGEIGYFSEGNRSSIAPWGTTLTIIPVTASLSYHFYKDSALSPYIGAGIGVYSINESDPD